MALVEALNRRFDTGRPSNDPAEAGIFQIGWSQTFSYPQERWNFYGYNNRVPASHASGSIINRGQRWAMCDLMCGGFVLDPTFVARSLTCAFAHDASTTGKSCANLNGFPPNRLVDALQAQRERLRAKPLVGRSSCHAGRGYMDSCYNEIVLRMDGPDGWDQNLPYAVQAVVYSRLATLPSFYSWEDDGCGSCERGGYEQVRREYLHFLDHFGIGESAIPLLEFDWQKLEAPFRMASRAPSR